jgi:hypothetical protein
MVGFPGVEHRLELTCTIENCTEPDSVVECLIGFVAETTIQSIKRPTDDTIALWYHAVSPIDPYLAEHILTCHPTAFQDLRQEQPFRLGPFPPT